MKQTPEVTVRLSAELLRKLIVVANAEKRTLNNQFLFMARNNIQYFEKTKGKIDSATLQAIDLTEFLTENNEK